MKCPLFRMTDRRVQLGEEREIRDCIGMDCEWWKQSSQLCAINRLAGELYTLVEVMEEIRDRLPKPIIEQLNDIRDHLSGIKDKLGEFNTSQGIRG